MKFILHNLAINYSSIFYTLIRAIVGVKLSKRLDRVTSKLAVPLFLLRTAMLLFGTFFIIHYLEFFSAGETIVFFNHSVYRWHSSMIIFSFFTYIVSVVSILTVKNERGTDFHYLITSNKPLYTKLSNTYIFLAILYFYLIILIPITLISFSVEPTNTILFILLYNIVFIVFIYSTVVKRAYYLGIKNKGITKITNAFYRLSSFYLLFIIIYSLFTFDPSSILLYLGLFIIALFMQVAKIAILRKKTCSIDIFANRPGPDIYKIISQKEHCLSVNNLHFSYENEIVFENLSLSLKPGTIYALFDKKESGKTTLLKCINNSSSNYWGSVKTVSNILLPNRFDFKKIENQTISSLIKGLVLLDPDFDTKKIKQMLADFNLTNYRNDKIKTFSTGMKNKLLLTFVLSSKSELFLIDEPLSFCDPVAHKQFSKLFAEFRKMNKTVIFSTDKLQSAFEDADEIIVLNNGKVELFKIDFADFDSFQKFIQEKN